MPPTPRDYGKRMFLGLVGSPWVLFPAAAGLTAICADWSTTGKLGVLAFAGLTGVAIGAGALITRWLTGSDGLAKLAQDEFAAEQRREHEQRFEHLDRRLRRDGDHRTNRTLAALRELEDRLAELEAHQDPNRRPPIEVSSKIRELLRSSLHSLERSAELYETKQRVVTQEARQQVRGARESLLNEVSASVDQIIQTLDGLYIRVLSRDKPATDLSRMRQELDTSLEVARRVEERVASLEYDLKDPSQAWDEPSSAETESGPDQ